MDPTIVEPSAPAPKSTAAILPEDARRALGRMAVLLLLVPAAFRDECAVLFSIADGFSEWSHLFVLPLVIASLAWLRRDDLAAAMKSGAWGGLWIILFGAAIWFAVKSLGLFGYLTFIAPLICMVGVVAATAGWSFLRRCLPFFLIVFTCLPLSERSMERFSLAVQRVSLAGAAALADAAPGVSVQARGLTITFERGRRTGEVGTGEQRFGFRLFPALLMIGLFVTFSRRRPAWQIVLLALSAPLVLVVANLARVTAAVCTAIFGGFDAVSNAPRNVSIVVGLLAAYLLFRLAAGIIGGLSRLESLFMVDAGSDAADGDEPDPRQTREAVR